MAEVSPSSPSKRARRESFGLVARPPRPLPLTAADLALPPIGYYIQSTSYEAGPESKPWDNGFGSTASTRERMEDNLKKMVNGHPIEWGYKIGTQQLLSIWVGWLAPESRSVPFRSEDVPPLVIRLQPAPPPVLGEKQRGGHKYDITMFTQLPNKPWASDIPKRVMIATFGNFFVSPLHQGMADSPLMVPMTVSVKTVMKILDFMVSQLVQRVETRRAIATEAREALVTGMVGEIAGFLPYNRQQQVPHTHRKCPPQRRLSTSTHT